MTIGYYGKPIKHILRDAGWSSKNKAKSRKVALKKAITEHGLPATIAALENLIRMWKKSNGDYDIDLCQRDILWAQQNN